MNILININFDKRSRKLTFIRSFAIYPYRTYRTNIPWKRIKFFDLIEVWTSKSGFERGVAT